MRSKGLSERGEEPARGGLDRATVEPCDARSSSGKAWCDRCEHRALADPPNAVHERDDGAVVVEVLKDAVHVALAAEHGLGGGPFEPIPESPRDRFHAFLMRFSRGLHSGPCIIALVPNRRSFRMNRRCVHVEYDLNVSTDEWLRQCQRVVDMMLSVDGLEWKLWVSSPASSSFGGIYLFRDEASAAAYVSGPVIAALRANPSVRDVRIHVYVVDDDL